MCISFSLSLSLYIYIYMYIIMHMYIKYGTLCYINDGHSHRVTRETSSYRLPRDN